MKNATVGRTLASAGSARESAAHASVRPTDDAAVPAAANSAPPREKNSAWVTKTLGEVCEIERGGSPRPIDHFLTNDSNGLNWIKIGDTKNVTKYIYETEEKIRPEGANRSRMVYPGDFILSNSMSFGRPYIMKTTGCIHDGWLVLREKLPNVDQDYLYHVLGSDLVFSQFDRLAAGSTVRNLNIGLVKTVEIPLPPLDEQRRIVGVLDEAFAGIAAAKAAAEKNLQNARDLFASHLDAVFSHPGPDWVEKSLSEVSKDFGRGKSKHRPRNDPKLYGGKYPFVQTGDVRNSEHLITSFNQTYNETGLAQSKLWPKGTLCITIAANIAETGVLNFDACFPDSVIGVVADEKQTTTKFLEYLLQSFKSRLQAQGKGSAQDNLNLGTFENQKFPFPIRHQQDKIVARFDALAAETTRLAGIYERKIAALDALKKSLLHRAFAGEL